MVKPRKFKRKEYRGTLDERMNFKEGEAAVDESNKQGKI